MTTKVDLLKEWLAQTCLEINDIFISEPVRFETFGQGTSFVIHLGEFQYKNFIHDIPNMGKIFFAGRSPIKYLTNKVIADFYLDKVKKFKQLAEQELLEPDAYLCNYSAILKNLLTRS